MELHQLLVALCDALVEFDPASISGGDCKALAMSLARAAKACEVASARATAQAAACGEVDAPLEWFARTGGCSTGTARTSLAAIASLAACPQTERAARAGEVSLVQAAEIASVPAHEAELLPLARASGLRPVKDAARKHRLATIPPEQLYAERMLHASSPTGATSSA